MMYEKEEKRVKREIKWLMRVRKITKGDKIVIFGACENSKIIIRLLRRMGFVVDRIVDNDAKKVGKYCSGVMVEDPYVLKGRQDEKIKILFYTSYGEEIASQLTSYGLKKNKAFYSLAKPEGIRRTCLVRGILVAEGLSLHKKLKKKYGENCPIFICPYTGTGDIYLIGLLLGHFLEKEQIGDYVFVVVSSACKKVAQIFGIKNIEQVKKEKAGAMVDANVFAPDLCRLLVLNDSWASIYTNPTEWLRGYHGLNFTEMFKTVVFGLEGEMALEAPGEGGFLPQAARFFEEVHLAPQRTVILAPYSNTLSELPNEFWEQVVKSLQEKGYKVCTNSCGPQEPAVKGTEAVFFPLNLAIPVVSMAGGFIGVRSGFCDIISSTKAKKVIIYEKDSYFYQGTTMEYFSLKGMGLCEDAVEIVFERNVEELCSMVMEQF